MNRYDLTGKNFQIPSLYLQHKRSNSFKVFLRNVALKTSGKCLKNFHKPSSITFTFIFLHSQQAFISAKCPLKVHHSLPFKARATCLLYVSRTKVSIYFTLLRNVNDICFSFITSPTLRSSK